VGAASAPNGSANTGGGAGGGGNSSNIAFAGGAGGSGIVIIRYLGNPIATGGTISTSAGFTTHTFTSSGIFGT
jgi:hypothetical protein